MRAHADYAQRTLESLPGYAATRARIAELDSAVSVRIGAVERRRDGSTFFLRRGARETSFKLVRRGADGTERLLVDPEELRKTLDQPHAIDYFETSQDGKRVAVGISAGGSELAALYLFDAMSGKRIEGPIDRARYSNPSWREDGRSFFYTRNAVLPPGAPASEGLKNRRSYLHVVGTDPERDTLLLGPGVTPHVPVLPTDSPFILSIPGSRFVIAGILSGVQREIALYAAPAESIDGPDVPWVKICDASDKVISVAVHGDDIYLLTYRDSPRYSIVGTRLDAPDARSARTVVAASENVITGMAAARDGLYFVVREGALKSLRKLAWTSKQATPVRFPIEGTTDLLAASPDIDGVIAGVSAWTRAREIYAVSADGRTRNTGLQPLGKFDAPADLVSTEVKVRSHDGALVPMSIIHRKDIKLDGTNPTLLLGYGSYGSTFDAGFDPTRIAWFERGGVFAIANVRGSSVYGEEWRKAGFKTTKPNTWKDFIACGEWLIAQKYTSATKLGIIGASAGGITVGRALTERPDLFAVAIPMVGMLDFVRLHVMPIGPVNVVEFGSIENEEEFRGLLAMSSYHHVKDGTKYPAVLLQHGVNDGRVNVGQSNKMAARLLAASTSGKPILLDLEYAGGHGQGLPRDLRQKQLVNQYAFLWWQMGDPAFQPK
jgi:prolyl oligopeptidase